MNKSELVKFVAKEAGSTTSTAAKHVDAVFAAIQGALKQKDAVRLIGFGTFSTRLRKAGTRRNPRTGEEVKVEQKYVPVFSAGTELKNVVKGAS